VSLSEKYALEVSREVDRQLRLLKRELIASASIKSRGAILTCPSKSQALEFANRFASEHLELLVKKPKEWIPSIRHAGALFIGSLSAEAFGDYTAGPNHVLPTGGTARYSSGLSVYDFLKRTNLLEMKPAGLKAYGQATVDFAEKEGLGAHARSVLLRLKPRNH
jgi:histidinol dehydrogenase